MLKFDKLVGDDAQGVTERVDVEFDLCHPLSSEVTLFIRSFAGSKCTVLPTVHCVNVFFFDTHNVRWKYFSANPVFHTSPPSRDTPFHGGSGVRQYMHTS